MAITTIATVTSLAQAEDEIRDRTGMWDSRDSKLYQLSLFNLLHDSFLLVRNQIAATQPGYEAMRSFYRTEPTTVAEASNLVDLSTLDVWSIDPRDLKYFDSNNGLATIMLQDEFDNHMTIYSTAMLANHFIGYVGNIAEKLQLKTYRGSSLASAGTLKLDYYRNPVKKILPTDKPDVTEDMLRMSIEMVINWLTTRQKVLAA